MAFPQIQPVKYEVGGCADISEFPRIENPETYEEFFQDFLLPNRPCIFSSAATADWQSRRDWMLKDGTPDFDFFSENFGEVMVPVADCGKEEYSAHPKQTMKLEDYIEYIQKYKQDGYPAQGRCLYLKDWHFTRDCSEYRAYSTPCYFSSDWLNEFWDTEKDQEDDYRFVYIGPKGSWTSFHADVFRSYSWSANICGRKKWIFFPPGEENKLKDKFGNLMYNVTEDIDETKFPNAKNVKKLEVIQESGEVIFVPSGWHHQVMNLVDTISINHNWINGCGIMRSWKYIKSSLVDVQRQIDDCRDMENWHEHCQLILKASSGIDYPEFFNFMSTIARHRINGIKKWEAENKTSTVFKQLIKEGKNNKIPSLNNAGSKVSKGADISCGSKDRSLEAETEAVSGNDGMDGETNSVDQFSKGNGMKSDCLHQSETMCSNKQSTNNDNDYVETVNNGKIKTQNSLQSEQSNYGEFNELSLKESDQEKSRIKVSELDKVTTQKCDQQIEEMIECETKPLNQEVDNDLDLSNKGSKDIEQYIFKSPIDLLPKDNEMSDEDYEIFWRFVNLHHAVFDLKRVREVLNDMKLDSNFQKLDYASLNVDEWLSNIDSVVDAYS